MITNFTYDALDRMTSMTYPGNAAENVAYTYDQSGFGIGRLTSVTDASGNLTRSYDERGNLLQETRTFPTATLSTTYAYDAASRLASITYPSGWLITYSRDSVGRLTGATAQSPTGVAQTIASAITYEPFGPANGIVYGNGISEKRSYDLDYRLTQISAASVQNLTYSYDAVNNVLGVADGLNSSNTQHFGYDTLNRVTSASGPYGSLSYSYDSNGNRLSEASLATTDGLNSVAAFTYNQAGFLAGRTTVASN